MFSEKNEFDAKIDQWLTEVEVAAITGISVHTLRAHRQRGIGMSISNTAVRLRGNKKVQNLKRMWYKYFRQHTVPQGDFGHEFS